MPRWTDCNKHETDIDVEEEKDTDNNTSQLSETNKTVAKTIKNEEESSRNEQDETKTNVQIQQNEDELPKGLEVLPISRKEHKEGVCEKCGKALNKKEVEERYQESRLLLQQADQYAAMKGISSSLSLDQFETSCLFTSFSSPLIFFLLLIYSMNIITLILFLLLIFIFKYFLFLFYTLFHFISFYFISFC